MTTQNMKLLDLQTGKYLELGKDWGYFGEYITLIKICTKTLIGTPYTRPLSPTHVPDRPTANIEEIINEIKICVSPYTNPIVNEIVENTGAVIYGGRYVLMMCDNWSVGDIVYDKTSGVPKVWCITKQDIDNTDSRLKCIGNIFEEYSKQFRNETNKFEELQDLLNKCMLDKIKVYRRSNAQKIWKKVLKRINLI